MNELDVWIDLLGFKLQWNNDPVGLLVAPSVSVYLPPPHEARGNDHRVSESRVCAGEDRGDGERYASDAPDCRDLLVDLEADVKVGHAPVEAEAYEVSQPTSDEAHD